MTGHDSGPNLIEVYAVLAEVGLRPALTAVPRGAVFSFRPGRRDGGFGRTEKLNAEQGQQP